MKVTKEEFQECLTYDSLTGIFRWVKPYRNKNYLIGKQAGSFDKDGYIQIKFKRTLWRAHRLAWLYVYGEWPKEQIDHKDGNRKNNAIENLREVTFAGNSQNQRIAHVDSEYGMLGVDKLSHRKLFRARIATNGKRVTLGYFKTAAEAHEAYLLAKRNLHVTCLI